MAQCAASRRFRKTAVPGPPGFSSVRLLQFGGGEACAIDRRTANQSVASPITNSSTGFGSGTGKFGLYRSANAYA